MMRRLQSMMRTIMVGTMLCALPVVVFAMQQIPSVANTITTASVDANKTLTVTGSLAQELDYTGQVYAVVSLNGADYSPIDQVVSPDAFVLNAGYGPLNYTLRFKLNVSPAQDDQLIMTWRDENSVPLDVDPVVLGEESVYADESLVVDYRISQCRHDTDLDVIFCAYEGTVPAEFTVEWYRDSVYGGKRLSQGQVEVILDEGSFVLSGQTLPAEDGLYPYIIRDASGRQVYQGSGRVGEIVIPELQTLSNEETLALTNYANNFLVQVVLLCLGFVGLALLAGLLLMGQTSMRFVYAAIIALLMGAGGFWYISNAAVFESTDYRQFRYTIATTPQGDDEYWVSFAALDTYTATPPLDQHVQITQDGTNWTDLIVDGTGQWSHTRSVTIPSSASSTTAVRVVDGCASYYGFSLYNAVTFGKRTCEPVSLFPSEDSIVGCMDPAASNYNPDAVIESGSCEYTGCTDPRAVNYNPVAVINNGSCDIYGCMNPAADNYEPYATTDDGSCTCGGGPCADIYGCMDPSATNYNPAATIDDGSCGVCSWIPVIPDPSSFCSSEVYFQTNTCTGATRNVTGTRTRSWQPPVNPSDICLGYSVVQTEVCSGIIPAPTRVVNGTGTGPYCIRPDADFVISTNLVNWTTCADITRLQIIRPDQPVYLRSVGTDDIDTWTISQAAGEVTGTVSEHQDDVYKIAFSYNVSQKNYQDIVITGSSLAGNASSQTCDLSLLNFAFEEL